MKDTTVLLVDDHAIFRMGLASLLGTAKGIKVVGDAGDGASAVEKALSLRPDVVIMDLIMPGGMDGAEATKTLIEKWPEAKVVILTTYETADGIGHALDAGARGAIVKKAQAFLNKYSLDQISRWQIASEVHVSEDYLTNIFKKELGVSPWDYLIALRSDYGYHLLLTTGIPISEVARRSGFHDSSYFSRVFKKLKGISPTRIRNSQ